MNSRSLVDIIVEPRDSTVHQSIEMAVALMQLLFYTVGTAAFIVFLVIAYIGADDGLVIVRNTRHASRGLRDFTDFAYVQAANSTVEDYSYIGKGLRGLSGIVSDLYDFGIGEAVGTAGTKFSGEYARGAYDMGIQYGGELARSTFTAIEDGTIGAYVDGAAVGMQKVDTYVNATLQQLHAVTGNLSTHTVEDFINNGSALLASGTRAVTHPAIGRVLDVANANLEEGERTGANHVIVNALAQTIGNVATITGQAAQNETITMLPDATAAVKQLVNKATELETSVEGYANPARELVSVVVSALNTRYNLTQAA